MSKIEFNGFLLNKCKSILPIILFVFFEGTVQFEVTTPFIDSLTNEALISARKNPERSISLAHRALTASKLSQYQKGIADANLALGAAHLASYNPNDSAEIFYHQALTIYTKLNDNNGLARASYGLSFLYNFKGYHQKAEEFGNQSVKYFQKAGNKKELVAAFGAAIYLVKQAGNYNIALDLSDKAIEIARSINDTLQWADALNNKGNVLKDMLLLSPAIDAYFEAFNLWKLSNDTAGLAIAYGSIANAYFFEEDYKKSLEYNFKKLTATKNSGNRWETNKTLNNIALAYSALDQQDSALFYIHKNLELAKTLNYPEGVANTFNNMAVSFLKSGLNDSALFYSIKAISLAEKLNSPNLAKYELNKAKILQQQKKYSSALTIAKKAYNRAKQKNDNLTLKVGSFLLNEIYYQMDKPDFAYPYLAEYHKLNDSILNMEHIRKVTRLDIQHKFEKKQKAAEFELEKNRQQIEILNQTNQIKSQKIRIFWIFIIAMILLSFAGAFISFLVIRNQNHRIEQMKLEIRNYLLKSNPKTDGHADDNPIVIIAEKYGLTAREAEIMELISTGIGNEEIATKLFVSKNTVKFHIKNLFIKLDVKNRVQAMQKSSLL